LDGTPFVEVIRRLEETYGIRVEVQAENVLQRRLSGAVENRDLEVITEALAKALRLEVRRNGNVVTFSRPLEEKE
jgi:ferric-dicitrate binding protein FerR (iron transport regulator)